MKCRLILAVVCGLMLPTSAWAQGVPPPTQLPIPNETSFRAFLEGAEENPPIANSGAWGTFQLTIDPAAQTASYILRVWNLPSGVSVGHIHVGTDNTNGPTVLTFTLPTNASNDFQVTQTVALSTITLRPETGIRSIQDFIESLRGGQCYANVHTVVNPGGEIRGQIQPIRPDAESPRAATPAR